MILTRKQEEAVKIGRDRFRAGEKSTIIGGYGGTGKSTVLSHVIEAIDIDPKQIAYATFTGKASLVLRQKGHNAQTLHKLLYDTQKIGSRFIFRPKRKLDADYKIVVVDELSMVPLDIAQLLASHNIHIIGLGDPGQLPPITNDNMLLNSPHIFLDEVMRQAQESEIIRLCMDIRAGKPLRLQHGKEVMVIDKKDIDPGMYLWADAIICGKNTTRRNGNHYVRGLKGIESLTPVEGDKMVCLRNYWDSETERTGESLINGMIGYAKDLGRICPVSGDVQMYFQPDFLTDGDGIKIYTDKNIYNWQDPREESIPYNGKIYEPNVEMDYGYFLTCHKTQGSEFNKVLLLEEVIRRDNHAKWLYTGASRAKEKLVVVRS